jgi:hypothetical protein
MGVTATAINFNRMSPIIATQNFFNPEDVGIKELVNEICNHLLK